MMLVAASDEEVGVIQGHGVTGQQRSRSERETWRWK